MSLIVANRVKETCTSPGVGTVSLLGAVIQFIAFSSKLANGNTTPYVIADQTGINWEVGIGTYATAGNTLTRTTVLSSSNAGSLVNFSSGSQNVWVDYPAEYTVLSSNNASQVSGQALISGGVGVAPSWGSSGVTSFAGNSTGLTPTAATTGAITLAGTLNVANGGTGVTTSTGTGSTVLSESPTLDNPTYTGTLTGSTGILNIGSGQLYKDASGNVGIGTSSPGAKLDVNGNTRVISGNYLALFESSNNNQWQFKNNTNNLTFTYNSTEAMRIDSAGNFLVGTTSNFGGRVNISLYQSGGQYGVVMRPSADSSSPFNFQNAAGTQIGGINCTSSATAYATSSDKRLKENIVNSPSALASVNAIKVRSFDWKASGEHQEYGYIAQELLEVAPEAVSVPTNEDEMMGVDFGKLTPRLVKAIQELKAIIEALTSRLTALEAK